MATKLFEGNSPIKLNTYDKIPTKNKIDRSILYGLHRRSRNGI